MIRQRKAVGGVQLFRGVPGGPPARRRQVVGGLTARTLPHQVGDVDVQPVLAPATAQGPRALVGERAHVGDVLRGQSAARCAECGDVVQQPVLGLRWQVGQQPLGDPCGGRCGVEEVVAQCSWPVVTQVDTDRAALGGRFGPHLGQRAVLERNHLRLVNLEHHRARRPRQPVGPGVEPGGQDDGLTYPGAGRGEEEVVEKPSAHGDLLAPLLQGERHILGAERDFAVQHAGEEPVCDRAHQRLGEPIIEQRIWFAGSQRSRSRHHRCGRTHAGGQIPAVPLGARRAK